MLFGGGRGGSARRYIVWYHPRRKQKPCGKPDLELPRSLLPNPTSASRMEHAKQNSTRRLAGLGGAYSASWIWLRRIFSASRFSYRRNSADSLALAVPMMVNIRSPVSSWGA